MTVRCYAAPMEGLTGAVFRRVHHRFFPGVDKYFMPFLSPGKEHHFQKRDLRELAPEQNAGLPAVPQLLTRSPEDFLWCAHALADLGYQEVNLNLGCPSGTVTAKGKGSGLLRDLGELERFLDDVFAGAEVAVSVKTRIGWRDPAEFGPLLALLSRYPMAELTVHPRVREEFYRGGAHLEAFQQAVEIWRGPLCYNGDLTAPGEVSALTERFPGLEAVMAGRGLAGDPALFRKVQGGPAAGRQELRDYHQALYEGYAEAFQNRRAAMMRMKELWSYLIFLFDGGERHAKALRKANDPAAFLDAAAAIFRDLPLREDSAGGWWDRPLF